MFPSFYYTTQFNIVPPSITQYGPMTPHPPLPHKTDPTVPSHHPVLNLKVIAAFDSEVVPVENFSKLRCNYLAFCGIFDHQQYFLQLLFYSCNSKQFQNIIIF